MRVQGVIVLGIGIIFGLSGIAIPTFGDSDEVAERLQRAEERYHDFFNRRRNLEERRRLRLLEAKDMQRLRLSRTSEHEAQRLDYIRTKVKRIEDPKLEQEWIREQTVQAQAKEQARRQYSADQQRIRRLTEGALQIPAMMEYDLDDEFYTTD